MQRSYPKAMRAVGHYRCTFYVRVEKPYISMLRKYAWAFTDWEKEMKSKTISSAYTS